MVYAIRLFDAVNVPAFTAAFEADPPWQRLSYQLDGYLHTGLLVRSTLPPSFMSLAIWQNKERFVAAENSVEYLNFNRSLRILSASYQSVGIFRYRCQPEKEEVPADSIRIFKPKGMHWRTYSRHMERMQEAESGSFPPWILISLLNSCSGSTARTMD